MNKKDKIMEAANKLEKSAIFNMSLASKELFHSNLWAWMMSSEKYGYEMAKIFFKDLKRKDFDCNKVEREKGNMDISFTNEAGDKLYVIENKLKSYPNQDQLKRYQGDEEEDINNKNENNFESGVITGIIEPNFKMDKWKFVRYDKISKKIKSNILPLVKGKDKIIVNEYCEMLNNIYILLKNFDKLLNNRLPIFDEQQKYIEKIKKIRMYDLCQKYIAYEFIDKFKNRKEYTKLKKLETKGWKLHTNTSYNHGKYTIDIIWRKNENTPKQMSVGIQIEGSEYRRVAEMRFNQKNDESNNKKVFNKYLKENWFFEYCPAKKDEFKKSKGSNLIGTSMQNLYGKYNSLKNTAEGATYYSHVYQYWNIKPENSNFEILYKEIYEDMIRAHKIIA